MSPWARSLHHANWPPVYKGRPRPFQPGLADEREVPELVRLLAPGRRRAAGYRFEEVLAETVLHAPSWTLRGGTREILRGIIARGLGLR